MKSFLIDENLPATLPFGTEDHVLRVQNLGHRLSDGEFEVY
jgi:hypothetical protein